MLLISGSVTLRQWQRLATPHMGGLFENKPGVHIKGERTIKLPEPQMYSLSDFEEDGRLVFMYKGCSINSWNFAIN